AASSYRSFEEDSVGCHSSPMLQYYSITCNEKCLYVLPDEQSRQRRQEGFRKSSYFLNYIKAQWITDYSPLREVGRHQQLVSRLLLCYFKGGSCLNLEAV
uniref:Uncharacterized protein n=1 Tax=Sparus aurata TaxID=8175 RepID=A0A671VQK9_SPAAU